METTSNNASASVLRPWLPQDWSLDQDEWSTDWADLRSQVVHTASRATTPPDTPGSTHLPYLPPDWNH